MKERHNSNLHHSARQCVPTISDFAFQVSMSSLMTICEKCTMSVVTGYVQQKAARSYLISYQICWGHAEQGCNPNGVARCSISAAVTICHQPAHPQGSRLLNTEVSACGYTGKQITACGILSVLRDGCDVSTCRYLCLLLPDLRTSLP